MNTAETWTNIHAERAALADTWEALTPDQWSASSWCGGWSVHVTAGHVLAAAEQTIPNFYKEFVQAGFRFNVFADRAARRLAEVPPADMVRRLRLRTTTTNHPPAPVVVMLGEIVVHGEDIRRPLGIQHAVAEEALVAVADNYSGTNLLIGSKRRIEGLRLAASDADWTHGDGPEVTGPLSSLILAMSGRTGALGDLDGPGVDLLTSRC
ncbi:MAG TPA: maleylpyruvate isomerase family mycothiol-dependent enzyme [Acidimicrobiales bacterium]